MGVDLREENGQGRAEQRREEQSRRAEQKSRREKVSK